MKKILLSLALTLGFGAYAFSQRGHDTAGTVSVPPISSTNSSQNPVSSTTPQNSGSGSSDSGTGTTTPTTPAAGSGSSGSGSTTPKTTAKFKDGTFTGPSTDAFYGNIQVQATISNGRITAVKFLQYPNDRSTSVEVNSQAMPILSQEAISAQSANVDIVSGATQTSEAFRSSLATALTEAKN